MIDGFEFSDAKQVRKTLLITSFAGICFKSLVRHSTGNIEFLGFKIPVEDASIIPSLAGYLIIYQIIALIIRYSDEDLRDKYEKYKNYIAEQNKQLEQQRLRGDLYDPEWRPRGIKVAAIKNGVMFLDLVLPLLLAFFALYKIFVEKF